MLMTGIMLACATALCATFALCYFARPICETLGLMDVPDERKLHRRPTPLLGGLALVLAALPVVAITTLTFADGAMLTTLLVIISATAAMALLGLGDDRHSLTARNRLLLSFIVFGFAAMIEPRLNVRVLSFATPAYELGLGTHWLAILFTVVCAVGLCNAVNMADGKNGLVIGLCIGWLSLLSVRAPAEILPIIIIIQSCLLILFVFNLFGKIFLGDGGSYGFATMIALLTIFIYNNPSPGRAHAISADEIVVLFAIPVFDSFRLTFARMMRGQSPMTADRDHLHHHFLDRMGWPGGLVAYLLVALLPATFWFLRG